MGKKHNFLLCSKMLVISLYVPTDGKGGKTLILEQVVTMQVN